MTRGEIEPRKAPEGRGISVEQTECLSKIMSDPKSLLTMIMASGKNVNDMGDPDACTLNPGTQYAFLMILGKPIYMGVCVPDVCGSSDLQILADGVTVLARQLQLFEHARGGVFIPSKDPPVVSGWHVVGFIGFGLIGIFLILGLLVEYTEFMGQIPPADEPLSDALQDKLLVKSKSLLGKIFLAFSPSRNLKKMFYTPQKKDDYLSALNGFRLLSLYFVVLGHTNSLMVHGGVINFTSVPSFINTWWAVLIGIGYYSVDVFFFISAFLATYLMVTKFYGKRSFNIPMLYLHRLIRVLPTLLLVYAIFFTFFQFIGSGPLWKPYVDYLISDCRDGWWQPLLFISSWYNKGNCFGQLWYLSNEMTYFLFVPLIVLTYLNSKLIGYCLITFLNIAGIILPFVFSHIRGHSISILKDPAEKYQDEIYGHPYTRFGAYTVGVLFGVLYFEWNRSRTDPGYRYSAGARFYNLFKKSTVLCIFAFVFSSAVMLFFILLPRVELQEPNERVISQIPSDFYNGFHRPTFVAFLGIFLAPLFVGRLTLVKDVFGGKLLAPWAKVTFVAYLIHLNVLGFVFMQTKASLYFDGPSQIFYSLTAFFITILISVPISLVIESPILQIERLVLFPPRQKSDLKEAQNALLQKIDPINESGISKDTSDMS
ncbi:unnamed protein product [Moneuplotes crassus]|uniref:Acyltransferase 3 domain-containing protein n=1 Tax=Euplotes crassus TaxID=5936 RepID=A0AAD1U5X3_EUPCR|nr:unnamed protein product [Moneuplotes crassus]